MARVGRLRPALCPPRPARPPRPLRLRACAPSRLRAFAPSHLRTFAPSYLRTFVPLHLLAPAHPALRGQRVAPASRIARGRHPLSCAFRQALFRIRRDDRSRTDPPRAIRRPPACAGLGGAHHARGARALVGGGRRTPRPRPPFHARHGPVGPAAVRSDRGRTRTPVRDRVRATHARHDDHMAARARTGAPNSGAESRSRSAPRP